MSGAQPTICDKLISRLEGSLQGVETPNSTMVQQEQQHLPQETGPSLDYSWQIFDQISLQQFDHVM